MDRIGSLEDIATVSSGSAIERGRSDARAVMVGDLDGSGVLPLDLTAVGAPRAGADAQLRPDDIVVSLRGAWNFAAVVEARDVEDRPLFATLDLAIVRLSEFGEIDPRFLATFLNLPSTQRALSVHRSGSAALRLPLGPLRDLPVPVPSYEHQRAIVALAKAAAKERELTDRLAQLRTDLMNKLLRLAAAEGPAPRMVSMQASSGPSSPGTTPRALSTASRKVT